MRFPILCSLSAATLVSLTAPPDQEPPEVPRPQVRASLLGEQAPALEGVTRIAGPEDAAFDLELLRGRVVVLEFWTTWCGACVGVIPHLDQLGEALEDEPITFLSLTNEPASIVQPFLARQPMRSVVLTDAGGEVWRRYGVTAIPETVLIDRMGRVAAITHPRFLTQAVLRDLLAGRPVQLPERDLAGVIPATTSHPPAPSWFLDEGRARARDQVLATVVVERSAATQLSPPFKDDEQGVWSGDGWPLQDLVRLAWDVAPAGLDHRLPTSPDRYRFAVQLPGAGTRRQRLLLQQGICAAFGLQARWEQRHRMAVVLQRTPDFEGGTLRHTTGSRRGQSFAFAEGGSHLEVGGADPATLATILHLCISSVREEARGLPVVDETGLEGRFDVARLEWPTGDAESLGQELASLGLRWEIERRETEVLVVEPAD